MCDHYYEERIIRSGAGRLAGTAQYQLMDEQQTRRQGSCTQHLSVKLVKNVSEVVERKRRLLAIRKIVHPMKRSGRELSTVARGGHSPQRSVKAVNGGTFQHNGRASLVFYP